MSRYKNKLHIVFGWKQPRSGAVEGEEFKEQIRSNQRRLYARFCFVLLPFLFLEPIFYPMDIGAGFIAIASFFAFLSLVFFIWVVVMTPFRTSNSFTLDPLRLFFDSIISSGFMILVFALFYRQFGTVPAGTSMDNIYFSAVTFSTLGFGDIGPCPHSQAFAAAEAMLGNLHLGFIVGATFAAISTNIKRQKRP